jgi:hypothetical protein
MAANKLHHRYSDPDGKTEDEEKDPFEIRLERSGCSKYHYQLQECYYEHNNDWRKCQNEMKEFRECMARQQQQLQHRTKSEKS